MQRRRSVDDEQIEPISPPPPERVAKRALVLAAVSCRGFIDSENSNASGVSDFAARIGPWLSDLALRSELSSWEASIIDAPFGTLSLRDRINATWLSEAVVVLAWALRRHELPRYDAQCDPAEAANSLGFLARREETILIDPELRDRESLHEFNEFIYNLHWRVRDYSVNRRRYDFENLARKAWGEPLLRHGLRLLRGDICIGDRPITESVEADWRKLMSITQERHRASNWLIGYASEDFYEVTTDT